MTRPTIAIALMILAACGTLAVMGAEIDLRLGPVRLCLTHTTPFC